MQNTMLDSVVSSDSQELFSDLFRGSDLDIRPTNVVWTKKEADGLHILSASNGSLWNGSSDARMTDIHIRRNYVGRYFR